MDKEVVVIARYLGARFKNARDKFLLFERVVKDDEAESLSPSSESSEVRRTEMPGLPNADRDPTEDKI